jgi:hypothetical protein
MIFETKMLAFLWGAGVGIGIQFLSILSMILYLVPEILGKY